MKIPSLMPLALIGVLVFGIQQQADCQNTGIKEQDNFHAAKKGSIIKSGKARFTFLTSQLIRMEWDSLGHFEDRASLVFINRNLPVPKINSKISDDWLIVTTEDLQISYKTGSGKFTAENLSIKFKLNRDEVTWHPGTDDTLNLKGTTRTLDGWFGGSLEDLENGLLSRNGWAFVDDSPTNLFDGDPDWNWVVQRPEGSRLDWYFFGYGHDYKKCLTDFTKIAGKIPMPPKYAFGYWWSRYWAYSDSELKSLMNDFKTYGIPIDILIVDMDWHETYDLTWTSENIDEFGQVIGWTGYTWNKDLFPDPEKFIDWTNTNNLKVALNLHPASGISPLEERYNEFAEAMNFDTRAQKNIPFQIENKKFAETYFNVLLKPFEETGVDFWWIDWQQWPFTKTIGNLSNTWWLNYTFYTDMERGGKRALLFHRWGGLGNHRYQIGFSGDAVVSWQSLKFQPRFTSTASNVGYGYWSHDIGGHIEMFIPTEPELYLRWLQYGIFSPMLRTHARKSGFMERRIWMFPGYFDLMKSAIELRYALVPYIYNYVRETYDTGISICRPLYYEHPEIDEAYRYKDQYYFGDDMMIAPVVDPVDKKTDLTMKDIWLPEGNWFEWTSGTMLAGGQIITRKYAMNDIPVFVKEGSIIPMYPKIDNLDSVGDEIILNIIPGSNSDMFIYDDDGISNEYLEDGFTKTKISTDYSDKNKLVVSISPRIGAYDDMPEKISYEIRIPNTIAPESVSINNKQIIEGRDRATGNWSFNVNNLETTIRLPYSGIDKEINVSVVFQKSFIEMAQLTDGIKGSFARLTKTVNKLKNATGGEYFIPDWLHGLESTPTRIGYNPQSAAEELVNFSTVYKTLSSKLKNIELGNKELISNALSGLAYSLSDEEKSLDVERRTKLKELENRVQYDFPYSERFRAGGKSALFDGKRAKKIFRDLNWQGFKKNDLSVTIDLKDNTPINNISATFLKYHLLGFFSPVYIEFYFSKDGKTFVNKGRIENNSQTDFDGDILIDTFEKDFKNESARFVKVVAKNMGINPDWHYEIGFKPGVEAWLFVDEIEIK